MRETGAEGTNTAIIKLRFLERQTQGFSLERSTNGEAERLLRFLQAKVGAKAGDRRLKAKVAGCPRGEHAACDRAGRGDGCIQGERIVRVVNPERLLHDGQQHLEFQAR